jgi:hypothetical protein
MESAEKAAQTQGKASILEFVRSVLTVGSVCIKKHFFSTVARQIDDVCAW